MNEKAAIAFLENVSAAQAQLQASCAIDVDRNGEGEFGYFAELAGIVQLRGETTRCSPPLLVRAFGEAPQGRYQFRGYWFHMCLPSGPDDWEPEVSPGSGCPAVNPMRAEDEWLCYAWPVTPGVTGDRAFLITRDGSVLATRRERGEPDSIAEPGRYGFRREGCRLVLAVNALDELGHAWSAID